MKRPSTVVGLLRGTAGAILGGMLGYYAFRWLGRQGLYALVLPGTMVGLGFGVCSGIRSPWGGIACGIAGVAYGLFTEWHWFPWPNDQSLGYFLTHLHKLQPLTIILILLGGFFSGWLGLGRGVSHVERHQPAWPPSIGEGDGSTGPEERE